MYLSDIQQYCHQHPLGIATTKLAKPTQEEGLPDSNKG